MKTRTEKIEFLQSIAAGETNPLQDQEMFWLYKDQKFHRITNEGAIVRCDNEYFTRFNGKNDLIFSANGETLPQIQGMNIKADTLKTFEAIIKLRNPNFTLKIKNNEQ